MTSYEPRSFLGGMFSSADRADSNGAHRERAKPIIHAEHDAQVLRELEPQRPVKARTARVVALIPAHNEEATIAKTVISLQQQTHPVRRILVMADNCTDKTVQVVRSLGVEVVRTVDNADKKGGAMNQGLALLMPGMDDDDFVMAVDADGEIEARAVEIAMQIFRERPGLGGISCSVRCRQPESYIETAQVLEYERGRRLMSRSKGHINVLSGAGTFLRVGVLREVANSRGTRLPGTQGEIMLAGNIVEDYELTCAIRELGYQVTSSKRIQMFSDIMPTWRELEGQRIRWYRGTIETIWLYGLRPYVRFPALAIAFNLLSSAVLALAIFFLIFGAVVWGAEPDWRYLLVIPLFMAEYVIVSRLVPGRLPKVVAWTFLPMFFYGAFLTYIYWESLIAAIRKHEFHWDGINVATKNGEA